MYDIVDILAFLPLGRLPGAFLKVPDSRSEAWLQRAELWLAHRTCLPFRKSFGIVEAEQKARAATAAVAKALANAAWVAFIATVLAASSAMLGAYIGGTCTNRAVAVDRSLP